MRKTVVFLAFALALVGMTVSVSQADEGMWPIFSLDQLNFDNLAARGLKLKAADIYNPNGTGLWAAVVALGGGTGSFVSPNGLIITNHHVAFGAIQSQSTAENNYIDKGFLARTIADEIPATGYNAWVCKSFDDVTKQVLGAVKSKATDLERYKAVEKATKEIIAKAEKGKDVKCRVAAFDEGRQYILITFLKIQDVRIVAVPPQGIGNYGGEIDNWMWPRHTGDYSFLRAYVAPDGKCAEYSKDNVPYKSAIYLPVSAAQLKEGDFDMTIGYPGGTSRFETSFGIDEALNFTYPRSVATRKVLIDIMEKASAENPEWGVRLSSRIKGLANYLKNFEAMITGLTRSHVVEQKVQLEQKLADALQQNPALQARYGHVLPDLKALYEKHGKTRLKDEALGWLGQSSRYFGFANQLYRWSLQKAKKDMDREPEFMERNVPSMRRGLKEAQVNLVPEVDKRMFAYVLHHAMALPADQRIAALDKLIGDTTKVGTDKAIETLVERLYSNTKLGTLDDRMKMFEMSNKELLAQNDAFIGLAASMYDDLEARRQQGKEFDGAQRRLNPQMIAAFRELKLGPAYPDANGTMRLTYGSIKGYSPADASHFACFTTLTGVVEKETGKEPFNSPPALLAVYKSHDFGPYLDSNLNDVPVNFLDTDDTTGGSSGSPVLNGKGELIGLCFDGNYEGLSADYKYDERVARTINVDSRYILFTLDKVMGAKELIGEMTIRR